ncbi:HD-GYP domain-containing protein [Paenibacillus psychroresistens]|uniref:HD-GYP domain-containing protein n=1 Tax=Paenibacillus psychroresistens TaxID=1778678 RepID=UPI0013918ED5|nr:HD-GYP domain-containing protein [Paenibacillus psychroresistens]
MNIHVKQESSPYRRFTLILGCSVVAIGLAIGLATILFINNFVVKDTNHFTKLAVQSHFNAFSILKDIFAEDKEAEEDEAYSMADHGMIDNYKGVDGLVHLHFDLYNFVSTRFYRTNGMITYSYNLKDVGTMLPASDQKAFDQVLKGVTLEKRQGAHGLHMWVPIENTSNKVIGVVELTRDITSQDASSRKVMLWIFVVIVICLLALFFALRQVFLRSTRTIDRKNHELADMVQTIESTYDQSLHALSSALDSRDNETHGHSFRVTSYAIRLGQSLGIEGVELGLLARGALLHDVGKIGVPDAILLKPGKLTEEEWVIMCKHVHTGYQMLSHIEFLQLSLDVVKHHHESWDGNGYPNGLRGEEIPLFARIFALCDTYDAITSDRPYRKRRSYAEARAEIIRCSGTQFSQEVVEAFLRIPEAEWTEIQQMDATASFGHDPMQRQAAASLEE